MKAYKWVYRFLLIVAGIIGAYLLSEYLSYVDTHQGDTVINTLFSSEGVVTNSFKDAYESINDGVLKWVVLILLEVVIYHCVRQALSIVTLQETEGAHTFKPFYKAQQRMLKVSVIAFLLEFVLVSLAINIFFGIFSFLAFLKPLLVLAVQGALMGFAIVDNYNEQFELTINQSFKYVLRKYLGVAVGIGVPLILILKIPFFGSILGPILCAVAVTIVMYEKSDLATIGYVPSAKEQAKIDKKAARKNRKKTAS